MQDLLWDLCSIGIDGIAGFIDPAVITNFAEEGGTLQSCKEMLPEEAVELINRDEVQLIDVRNASEWAQGHIPEAKHVMLGTLQGRLKELSRQKPIEVQCQSGARSAIGCSLLQAAGFQDIINLSGGFSKWQQAGLPQKR